MKNHYRIDLLGNTFDILLDEQVEIGTARRFRYHESGLEGFKINPVTLLGNLSPEALGRLLQCHRSQSPEVQLP